jgi:hypothetical protein
VLKGIVMATSRLFLDSLRRIQDAAYAALTLGFLDQLLSCPDALLVVVCRGLSAEVQEAARGGSAAASMCMAVVHCQIQFMARLLHTSGQAFSSTDDLSHRAAAVESKLADFLNCQEVAPLLELLCLPLDPGASPHCALKLEPALPGAAVPAAGPRHVPTLCPKVRTRPSWSCCACRCSNVSVSALHTGSCL